MTKPKEFNSNRQIRFTESLYLRIEMYINYVKNKTGARINFSEAVRSLIEEALDDLEIKNDNL